MRKPTILVTIQFINTIIEANKRKKYFILLKTCLKNL